MDKLVASLTKKSLNGPTPLDSKWKELMDQQEVRESDVSRHICSPIRSDRKYIWAMMKLPLFQ